MSVSWIRITLLVFGVLVTIPATLLFGLFGFIASLVFIVLVAVAK